MRIGVVIGRWQVPELHQGHRFLIDSVIQKSEKLIIFIGVPAFRGSKRDPLSYEMREQMINDYILGSFRLPFEVAPIHDKPDDQIWSLEVDKLIGALTDTGDEIALYGGRDSFKDHYHGQYPVIEISDGPQCDATSIRKRIAERTPDEDPLFREGVIYATMHHFDTVSATVDIICYRPVGDRFEVLVGRKPAEIAWRFPGGFADATDKNLEHAAHREFLEETCLTAEGGMQYIGSTVVNDWRTAKSPDKAIMTTLFACEYSFGHPLAGDDLAEVKWMTTIEAMPVLNKGHRKLLAMFQEWKLHVLLSKPNPAVRQLQTYTLEAVSSGNK